MFPCYPLFVSPTNLHCSQTIRDFIADDNLFVSPTNLHCSQPPATGVSTDLCLFPLQIYTALKPQIIQEKYLRNICVTFIVYWKHFYSNIKYIDLHPL